MYQTRSEINGIKEYQTFDLAYSEAKKDSSIWKISWDLFERERIRLVKNKEGYFEVRQMMDELEKYMDEVFHRAVMEVCEDSSCFGTCGKHHPFDKKDKRNKDA